MMERNKTVATICITASVIFTIFRLAGNEEIIEGIILQTADYLNIKFTFISLFLIICIPSASSYHVFTKTL